MLLNISLISRPPCGRSGPFCMICSEQFPVSLLSHTFTPFKLLSLSLGSLAYDSDSGAQGGKVDLSGQLKAAVGQKSEFYRVVTCGHCVWQAQRMARDEVSPVF